MSIFDVKHDVNHLIVNKANLALTPGNWFGNIHKQFMRMNIASLLAIIQDAFKRLKMVLDSDLDCTELEGNTSNTCCSC